MLYCTMCLLDGELESSEITLISVGDSCQFGNKNSFLFIKEDKRNSHDSLFDSQLSS